MLQNNQNYCQIFIVEMEGGMFHVYLTKRIRSNSIDLYRIGFACFTAIIPKV